ncbi:MAG TPA: NAD(P)H-hydrate epimerase, partial [Deinococcales bacterium]|nr:NAD(P)H-hydrate epimerase [Deinococcales bacterium]
MRVIQRATDLKATDRASVEAGIPFLLLMEAAGRAVAEAVHREAPAARVVVLAGRGANGGDGLVAARWLRHWGHDVLALSTAQDDDGSASPGGPGAPPEVWTAMHAFNLRPQAATVQAFLQALQGADVVLDALYGAGFRPPLSGSDAALLATLNLERSQRPSLQVWSVDLPSGLAADRAAVSGEAVRADRTVALTSLKPAHLFAPASDCCGVVEVGSAGVPEDLVRERCCALLAEAADIATLLPVRSRGAHKGTAGRVVVAGGIPRYPGAPALAALGALRAGAGLVTVASPPGAGLAAPVEATRHEVPAWTVAAVEDLVSLQPDAVAAGMGMGPVDDETLAALARLDARLVLDADALQPSLAGLLGGREAVLTPHPGEAARLLGGSTGEVVADPLGAATALAERFRAVAAPRGSATTSPVLPP